MVYPIIYRGQGIVMKDYTRYDTYNYKFINTNFLPIFLTKHLSKDHNESGDFVHVPSNPEKQIEEQLDNSSSNSLDDPCSEESEWVTV